MFRKGWLCGSVPLRMVVRERVAADGYPGSRSIQALEIHLSTLLAQTGQGRLADALISRRDQLRGDVLQSDGDRRLQPS